MPSFDLTIIQAVLHALDQPVLTWAMHKVMEIDLLRMGPVVALLFYVWLGPQARLPERAEMVARSLIGIMVAAVVSQVLQALLPKRPRPLHAGTGLAFPPWPGASYEWSSFPSDTAALTFAMVAVIWAASRPLGLLAAGWSAVAIVLPRLYFGLHYPSDVIAGAALGMACVGLALRLPALAPPAAWFRRVTERHPAVVLVLLALLCSDFIGSLFTPRQILSAAKDLVHVVEN